MKEYVNYSRTKIVIYITLVTGLSLFFYNSNKNPKIDGIVVKKQIHLFPVDSNEISLKNETSTSNFNEIFELEQQSQKLDQRKPLKSFETPPVLPSPFK